MRSVARGFILGIFVWCCCFSQQAARAQTGQIAFALPGEQNIVDTTVGTYCGTPFNNTQTDQGLYGPLTLRSDLSLLRIGGNWVADTVIETGKSSLGGGQSTYTSTLTESGVVTTTENGNWNDGGGTVYSPITSTETIDLNSGAYSWNRSVHVTSGCISDTDTQQRTATLPITFEPAPEVTVNVIGNGTVTSSDGSINCGATCTASYGIHKQIVLTATPAAGWMFSGWSNGCSGTETCMLTTNSAGDHSNPFATFTVSASSILTVTVNKSDQIGNGVVTSQPAGINCPGTCSAPFAPGTLVTLTATPASAAAAPFTWQGCTNSNNTLTACTLPINGPTSVSVDFGDWFIHTSSIWAGCYEAANVGAGYTQAQATWVVPPVAGAVLPVRSSTWVGIGGIGSDATLIQLGTEQDAWLLGQNYYAWWEVITPGNLVEQAGAKPIGDSGSVKPGDVITASLACATNCTPNAEDQTWQLALTNSTQGWTWNKIIPYTSSLASVEWIEENPTTCVHGVCFTFPLANYGSVTFSQATANGANPNLSTINISQPMMTNALAEIPPNYLQLPSVPVGGNSFSVCSMGAGTTTTACSPSGASYAPSPNGPLVSAVLPSSRSVQIGSTATAFATMINTAATTAMGCGIAPGNTVPATLTYQTTDPLSNAVIGMANTPANIPAGGSQTFVLALTSTAEIDPTGVSFNFSCAGMPAAAVTAGVNTLLFSGPAIPTADIVALVASPTNDGILHIKGTSGSNAFAVATVNVNAGDTITATPSTGTVPLSLNLSICQTNPVTGQCMAAAASSVSASVTSNATPTFAVFATATGQVPFVPATDRIFVVFTDSSGAVRGATSVAVDTE